jgi:hypothetical protein
LEGREVRGSSWIPPISGMASGSLFPTKALVALLRKERRRARGTT